MPMKSRLGDNEWARLIHGDCLDVLRTLESGSVDAVVTDPPYPRKFLPTFIAMVKELPRILKVGGSFLSIIPHYAVPELMSEIGKHLRYQWLLSMWQGSCGAANWSRKIRAMWKPIGWWTNGEARLNGWNYDGFANPRKSKVYHPWEQHSAWADYCLRFVPDRGTVLDPFMGSGTTAVSCLHSNRQFIGVEIDKSTYRDAERKISLYADRKQIRDQALERAKQQIGSKDRPA